MAEAQDRSRRRLADVRAVRRALGAGIVMVTWTDAGGTTDVVLSGGEPADFAASLRELVALERAVSRLVHLSSRNVPPGMTRRQVARLLRRERRMPSIEERIRQNHQELRR